MVDPRSITPNSIMPNYPWLMTTKVDFLSLRKKLSTFKYLGVPYMDDDIANADIKAEQDAKLIADGLSKEGAPSGLADKEVVALIAYLQALGQMNTSGGK
jgi:cytochrome c oxidase cbb3-type subunit I/II